jgi:uncharacterized protein (TIGR03437 family)
MNTTPGPLGHSDPILPAPDPDPVFPPHGPAPDEPETILETLSAHARPQRLQAQHPIWRRYGLAVFLALPFTLGAQLIPAGQPVPKGPNTPVVFLNGYQIDCGGSNFAGTFGNADTVLQASQIVTLFFDNCSLSDKPSIEALGIAFGQFLASLKYTDGTPVPQVDVVAHSMGGLIVRSYLAGKQDVSPAAFTPPPSPGIRKVVFLATPHFGTGIASAFGTDKQTNELAVGSQFLFDLNTWNDGTDDLRGVDALAVVGNAGTGEESTIPGFDDGVVTLTSASIAFARQGRTRVVPACHANVILLTAFSHYCPSNSVFVALVPDSSSINGQIIVSFLTGTTAWQSLGQAIESNPVASTLGGINIEAQDLNGIAQPFGSAAVTTPGGTFNLSIHGNIALSEGLTPNTSLSTLIKFGTVTVSPAVTLPATTVLPVIAKTGPVIFHAIPAGSAVFPLNAAPGEFVTIYGANLSTVTQLAAAQPYPIQIADVQVLVNGTAVPVEYISPAQINIVYPNLSPALTQFTVINSAGKHTANLLLVPAVPSVFSLDSSGTGPASVINGITGQVIGSATPLHAGDYASIFLTGLGQTTRLNGLDYSQIVPSVSIGGQTCVVTYAGRAPTLEGVDQINCQLPAGITAVSPVPLIVTSNGRNSNTVTLAVQ